MNAPIFHDNPATKLIAHNLEAFEKNQIVGLFTIVDADIPLGAGTLICIPANDLERSFQKVLVGVILAFFRVCEMVEIPIPFMRAMLVNAFARALSQAESTKTAQATGNPDAVQHIYPPTNEN